ncbi:hypothetical protein NLG97_g7784 [Lecanicillium saksenae]|uniref:Uncharacterized protein n=1 Tax=Lecanicillium saksenae TaxID=468837 RepID=A0ACC1QN55_9HYPO|nr:hypothetical protein NLG97_g7784 [Lecanicillium saksenae]
MDPNQQLPQASAGRKRKADAQQQDNERLSKRLSLLNIEQDGTKLYVPVESPSPSPKPQARNGDGNNDDGDDSMRLDDSDGAAPLEIGMEDLKAAMERTPRNITKFMTDSYEAWSRQFKRA